MRCACCGVFALRTTSWSNVDLGRADIGRERERKLDLGQRKRAAQALDLFVLHSMPFGPERARACEIARLALGHEPMRCLGVANDRRDVVLCDTRRQRGKAT